MGYHQQGKEIKLSRASFRTFQAAVETSICLGYLLGTSGSAQQGIDFTQNLRESTYKVFTSVKSANFGAETQSCIS
jgi:hypothetical protein